jgi:hypothetical protein
MGAGRGPPDLSQMWTGKVMHAGSLPFYFGCTTVWGTYIAVQGLPG